MNVILPKQLPEPVAVATADMLHVLAGEYWGDLTEDQRDFVASLYFYRPERITAAEATAVTKLYAAVVGVRT